MIEMILRNNNLDDYLNTIDKKLYNLSLKNINNNNTIIVNTTQNYQIYNSEYNFETYIINYNIEDDVIIADCCIHFSEDININGMIEFIVVFDYINNQIVFNSTDNIYEYYNGDINIIEEILKNVLK